MRSNTSPAAPTWNSTHDSLYQQHGNYGSDSVPSFNSASSAGSYDMMSSISSNYSSGKQTPLTPNDPMHHSGFGGMLKQEPQSAYPDLSQDRRLSYGQTDVHDDYSQLGAQSFGNTSLPPFNRFQQSDPLYPPTTIPSHGSHFGRSDQAGYDDVQGYMPNPGTDHLSLRIPGIDDNMMRRIQPHGGLHSAGDLSSFIRPFLEQYVRAPNRLAFGERSVIVMSSKVAQKSYGQEKRFLCPPPTAIMIGNSWWSDVVRRGEEPRLAPPRVVVSISGEPAPQEGTVEWTAAAGKPFDASDPPTGTTYIGRCVGKQLFISDVDEKKKKVEALVRIVAPANEDEPERVIGTFPSRPIKVISKPSKKRQSAKNLELCINHGSTISLFHRLRSQTVSTKYLCVSGSGASFKGSDGAPLLGVDQRTRSATPSFIARTSSWDPFVMYIVDADKPGGGMDAPPPPPPQPDYPSPPPNAIPFMANGTPIPIYYNQTVVLQCLTSGVVSPVLIIRKVDHQTTVVGGGAPEGAKGVGDAYCGAGEVCGDPVSQLHKVAFEVYEHGKVAPEPGTTGASGAFLSCMGEKVNTYRPAEGRVWTASANAAATSALGGGILDSPMESPLVQTPGSLAGGSGDYFGSPLGDTTDPAMDVTNNGGRVKTKKRSSSSAGGMSRGSASSKGGRRRPGSAGGSGGRGGDQLSSGAMWQVDIGETSVWTIVGTDQVRYNFYVPPVLFDQQTAPQGHGFPVPSKPVTPFPGVVKYLPPDRAAEAPKRHHILSPGATSFAGQGGKPAPSGKLLTLYGENFNKSEPLGVFFGAEGSQYVETRCAEVMGCLPPEGAQTKRRPILLVRSDGVVFPSSVMYP
ncbi:LAG1-DNAbind-domain-containing protein [Peniophora sp. CONT]|nr:LAG1-DNAbind-domain-containing protein [Peniophora sp. CONT]